eukprot:c26961_g2_i2 orf=79-258(+)
MIFDTTYIFTIIQFTWEPQEGSANKQEHLQLVRCLLVSHRDGSANMQTQFTNGYMFSAL